jgi:hemoglobin-like flavoprotein
MALQTALLRNSFALVVEREPELTRRFYGVLFSRYPELAPLFSPSRQREQEKMLAQALVAVLDHLEDNAWLTQQLAALGARHVGYGVTEPMYGQVAECLLVALAQVAGPDWSDEIQQAWSDALGAVAELMLAGAREAGAAA